MLVRLCILLCQLGGRARQAGGRRSSEARRGRRGSDSGRWRWRGGRGRRGLGGRDGRRGRGCGRRGGGAAEGPHGLGWAGAGGLRRRRGVESSRDDGSEGQTDGTSSPAEVGSVPTRQRPPSRPHLPSPKSSQGRPEQQAESMSGQSALSCWARPLCSRSLMARFASAPPPAPRRTRTDPGRGARGGLACAVARRERARTRELTGHAALIPAGLSQVLESIYPDELESASLRRRLPCTLARRDDR